nr:protein wntless [Onthophagus taurus]
MAGTVLENLSGRKLSILVAILLILQVLCFMIGGFIAPSPAGHQGITATVCVDEEAGKNREKWFTTDCGRKIDLASRDPIKNVLPDNLVFVFQLPLGMPKFDFSRWQQNLVGVLEFDLVHVPPFSLDPVVDLGLDVKLAYKNRGDVKWNDYAVSIEKRTMDCIAGYDQGNALPDYMCSTVPLFELGALHHDYYLLNMRLPSGAGKNNIQAKIADVRLHVIYMNGGFTMICLGLKTFLFPCLLAVMFWFWRRVHILSRTPALLEYMLITLAGSLLIFNTPIEYLSLYFEMPYMLLLSDIRQGIFYATLLSFWLIFAGEHMLIQDSGEKNTIKKYWKHLSAIIIGCASLLIFDFCERGIQLKNPFYTIWTTPLGTNLALSFIILAGISASIYFIFLCYMIWKVFRNISIKRDTLPNMSSARRFHYEGIIYRFNFLMLATVICAAVTIVTFIYGQIYEGQHNWDDDMEHIEVSSAVFTGVYGMWNVYVCAMLMLYAPSHKQWPTEPICREHGDEVEFSRLATDPCASEIASLTSFASKATID